MDSFRSSSNFMVLPKQLILIKWVTNCELDTSYNMRYLQFYLCVRQSLFIAGFRRVHDTSASTLQATKKVRHQLSRNNKTPVATMERNKAAVMNRLKIIFNSLNNIDADRWILFKLCKPLIDSIKLEISKCFSSTSVPRIPYDLAFRRRHKNLIDNQPKTSLEESISSYI